MRPDSIAFGIAGVCFGLIAGWVIGSQQASTRPSVPQAQAAAQQSPSSSGGQTVLVPVRFSAPLRAPSSTFLDPFEVIVSGASA